VSNTCLSPAALATLMQDIPLPLAQYRLSLRAIATTGAPLEAAVFKWCAEALNITPNEVFGQTEMPQIIGNSYKKWPARPGSMGRPYPGHRVAILDSKGQPCPPGKTGEIALHCRDLNGHPDPALFLGYWRNEAATQARFQNDWCLTGELAQVDD